MLPFTRGALRRVRPARIVATNARLSSPLAARSSSTPLRVQHRNSSGLDTSIAETQTSTDVNGSGESLLRKTNLNNVNSTTIQVELRARSVHLSYSEGTQGRTLHANALRDGCTCSKCKDPHSGQKAFATTQVDPDTKIKKVEKTKEGLQFTFDREIPSLAGTESSEHVTVLPWSEVDYVMQITPKRSRVHPASQAGVSLRIGIEHWDRDIISERVRSIDYDDYVQASDAMWDAVTDLVRYGLVFLRNVPKDPEAVTKITTTIANIQETFYGRTFDVKAKPNAENVAYTSGYLGLHQDLLYLDERPKIQVLHCLENSCAGGESLFSDGDRVGRLLANFRSETSVGIDELFKRRIHYEYSKNGYLYSNWRRFLTRQTDGSFTGLNWSPPFQGPRTRLSTNRTPLIMGARLIEELINQESVVYERKMEPGECVLFDNARVMHGRKAFDAAGGGSRWLRGAYIATDAFYSKAAHIPDRHAEEARGEKGLMTLLEIQEALKETRWHKEVSVKVAEMDAALAKFRQARKSSRVDPQPV